jgi:lipid-A-disaccharide synthase
MSDTIFFSAGEPSGAQHAARLMNAMRLLRPNCRFRGFGGPEMVAAGGRLDADITSMSVMGILEALPQVRRYWNLAQHAKRVFKNGEVDAVVLLDCPGFNWHIAKYARQAGVPVIYYLPPQLWAWAPWRLKKIRRHVDQVLSVLPFEHKWYQERGIDSLYVGHPFFDAVAETPLDQQLMERLGHLRAEGNRLIAILPGSRQQEVRRNGPLLFETIKRLAKNHPERRFLVACYRDGHCLWLRSLLKAQGGENLPVDFFVGRTSEIIEAAECAAMVSGSVSLEMLARTTPATVVYRVGPLFQAVANHLVKLPSFTLPNLIAGRKLFPEFLSAGNPEPAIVGMVESVTRMLEDREHSAKLAEELQALKQSFAHPGASRSAARAVVRWLPAAAPLSRAA